MAVFIGIYCKRPPVLTDFIDFSAKKRLKYAGHSFPDQLFEFTSEHGLYLSVSSIQDQYLNQNKEKVRLKRKRLMLKNQILG
jgi:hypothetical protein